MKKTLRSYCEFALVVGALAILGWVALQDYSNVPAELMAGF
jgi:hypothetical protein